MAKTNGKASNGNGNGKVENKPVVIKENRDGFTDKWGKFHGEPLLVLSYGDDDKYPFSFGPGKVRRVKGAIDSAGSPKEFYNILIKFLDSCSK